MAQTFLPGTKTFWTTSFVNRLKNNKLNCTIRAADRSVCCPLIELSFCEQVTILRSSHQWKQRAYLCVCFIEVQ